MKMKTFFERVVTELRDIIKLSRFNDSVYLVGGCVRDQLLGNEPKDIDLCIDYPNGVEEFASWLKEDHPTKCHGFCEFPRFGTMKFIFILSTGEEADIECVIPRIETYNNGPRKPDSVLQTSIEIDARRRDFCCNAVYYNITKETYLDPTGYGVYDCENNILRTPTEASYTFVDDPLRMLRAIRFYCTKGFEIEEDTKRAIYPYQEYFKLSMERVRDEFMKILMSPKPVEGIKLLHDHGLLKYIFKPLVECWNFDQKSKYHSLSLIDHTFAVLEHTTKSHLGDDPRLRMAALLHDISKYKTFTFDGTYNHYKKHEESSAELAEGLLNRLKFDKDFVKDVRFLIANHMRGFKQQYDYKNHKYTGSDKAIRKFVLDMGDYLELELELMDADNNSHSPIYNMPEQVKCIREKIKSLSDVVKVNYLVSGNDIMDYFGLKPGISIKEIKCKLQDYLDENPTLTKEDVLAKYKKEYGGKKLYLVKKYSDSFEAFLDPVEYYTSGNFGYWRTVDSNIPRVSLVESDPRVKFNNSADCLEVDAIEFPNLYDCLSRHRTASIILDEVSKCLGKMELIEGFKEVKIKFEGHDFSATVEWDDDSTTTVL